MVKTLKNHLLKKQESFEAESWYIAKWTRLPGRRLTFDLFMARSNLLPHTFCGENVIKSFLEIFYRLMTETYNV